MNGDKWQLALESHLPTHLLRKVWRLQIELWAHTFKGCLSSSNSIRILEENLDFGVDFPIGSCLEAQVQENKSKLRTLRTFQFDFKIFKIYIYIYIYIILNWVWNLDWFWILRSFGFWFFLGFHLEFLGSNFDTNWNFGVLILVSALEERKKQRKKIIRKNKRRQWGLRVKLEFQLESKGKSINYCEK